MLPDANQPLLPLAAQELPDRLAVEFNFLTTATIANLAVPQSMLAFGTLAACGGDAAKPVTCADDTCYELQEGIYPPASTSRLRSQIHRGFPRERHRV
ncbi:MAG: hypothetical protein ABSH48_28145 [Verrucomicrobiota bacterium]